MSLQTTRTAPAHGEAFRDNALPLAPESVAATAAALEVRGVS
jgi:hypothetical protein